MNKKGKHWPACLQLLPSHNHTQSSTQSQQSPAPPTPTRLHFHHRAQQEQLSTHCAPLCEHNRPYLRRESGREVVPTNLSDRLTDCLSEWRLLLRSDVIHLHAYGTQRGRRRQLAKSPTRSAVRIISVVVHWGKELQVETNARTRATAAEAAATWQSMGKKEFKCAAAVAAAHQRSSSVELE